ncbi:MAG: IS701 family transposase [Chloroflexota bacterium]
MDLTEFDRVAGAFAAFHGQFARFFGRTEARHRSEQYLRGLLIQQTDRRNAENVAEAVGDATPRSLQRLLTEAPWESTPVLDALQRYVAPRLNTGEGVFVLDETGFPKKGTKSVGVARQYCGTLGKVGNCQLGVFLAYVSERGHALVDGRLYLPHAWIDDRSRCQAAGVPAKVDYQSKAALGLAMLGHARTLGAWTGHWVTADADYGKVPSLRDTLDADGWWYVLEVPAITPVFVEPAEAAVPPWSGHGRKPTRPRLGEGAPSAPSMQDWVADLAPERWEVLTVAEGAQGPRRYQFVRQRGWECRDGVPGRESWLVARRNLDGSELKFYLSNAPAATTLPTLGQVGAGRWPIETEFQTEKGETGLSDYEVRGWNGWHHHITLALLAGAFLLTVEQDWGKKSARPDAPTGQSGPAGIAPTAPLDRRRPLAVAA